MNRKTDRQVDKQNKYAGKLVHENSILKIKLDYFRRYLWINYFALMKIAKIATDRKDTFRQMGGHTDRQLEK